VSAPVVILPKDEVRRRAILRRVLDGQAVVYAVQIYAFLGGEVKDFHTAAERQMCDDLVALGYRPRAQPHFNSLLHAVWVHDDPDFIEPMPMPILEDEADCIGPVRSAEEIASDMKRRLDEAYGEDEPC
jgi:hypothetical protein